MKTFHKCCKVIVIITSIVGAVINITNGNWLGLVSNILVLGAVT